MAQLRDTLTVFIDKFGEGYLYKVFIKIIFYTFLDFLDYLS